MVKKELAVSRSKGIQERHARHYRNGRVTVVNPKIVRPKYPFSPFKVGPQPVHRRGMPSVAPVRLPPKAVPEVFVARKPGDLLQDESLQRIMRRVFANDFKYVFNRDPEAVLDYAVQLFQDEFADNKFVSEAELVGALKKWWEEDFYNALDDFDGGALSWFVYLFDRNMAGGTKGLGEILGNPDTVRWYSDPMDGKVISKDSNGINDDWDVVYESEGNSGFRDYWEDLKMPSIPPNMVPAEKARVEALLGSIKKLNKAGIRCAVVDAYDEFSLVVPKGMKAAAEAVLATSTEFTAFPKK